MTQDEIKRFLKMYRDGATFQEMEAELYYHRGTFRLLAEKMGLPKRHRGRRRWEELASKKDIEEFRDQWNSGVSGTKMCQWWGVSRSGLNEIRKRLGLEPRRSRWS